MHDELLGKLPAAKLPIHPQKWSPILSTYSRIFMKKYKERGLRCAHNVVILFEIGFLSKQCTYLILFYWLASNALKVNTQTPDVSKYYYLQNTYLLQHLKKPYFRTEWISSFSSKARNGIPSSFSTYFSRDKKIQLFTLTHPCCFNYQK